MALKYLEGKDVQDQRRDTCAPNYGRNVDGYGSKIPTGHWLKVKNRWRRVYVMCFSNSGTLYITQNKETVIVNDWILQE